MKKLLVVCTLSALITGCASHRVYIYNENHSAKESRHPDTIPVSSKENRFTKQFQQADSVFNEKLNQIE